ncbi:Signal transduction histidine kinase [Pedobacter steynii]|uniref:Oxygen sensor histidine kinase NreB n=1 Tax=Pedobacter steynii TaxID=430522 RepID=A0A1G9UZ77_9SPHI|nr:ATP-binding protein [Pedobacter steynii]NQX40929.1 hypothetical protein [Pedobacter steynii]SDM65254.1 Signal transduction histidine kinase [Pedobacter steynii]
MEEIYATIIIISIILLILCIGIVFAIVNYKVKQRVYLEEKKTMQEDFENQLMKSQIEVQEITFEELGKELHDNVGQLLSSTKMLLGVTQRSLAEIPETLNLAEETLGKAINELRALTKSLDKEWLERFDLITNLEAEINRINVAKTTHINFTHCGKLPIDTQKQIILFRIMQEALQNAIKHADAASISINITMTSNTISLKIYDDGIGFEMQSANTGLGISNMKHRTALLGGTISWNVSATGSRVNIQLPIKDNDHEN